MVFKITPYIVLCENVTRSPTSVALRAGNAKSIFGIAAILYNK